MPLIHSEAEAQKMLEKFIPNKKDAELVAAFVAEAILFADTENGGNWNVNLDDAGYFIRFNAGSFCAIEINKDGVIAYCDKNEVADLGGQIFDLVFLVYDGKEPLRNKDIHKLAAYSSQDTLQGSVGCVLQIKDIQAHLSALKAGNRAFIKRAVHKYKIRSHMLRAHSKGFVSYLSKATGQKL